ncbi:hypothetical protein BDV95DRAFT_59398 [Massariosphaeria phaeospora]|uniref:Uncharacterized protein n=1 Tax=Massariosphaeria phaeospora TaxID=100035 RepID=A0A7C8MK64_9PLEO|nr:hypothetical protein BDV95DRAFT_59398 [Massariosphaeria phaeospora]
MSSPSLDFGLAGSHVLVAGGAGLIGRVVIQHFVAAGSHVSSLDISYPPDSTTDPSFAFSSFHCDVASEGPLGVLYLQRIRRSCFKAMQPKRSTQPASCSTTGASADPESWPALTPAAYPLCQPARVRRVIARDVAASVALSAN